MIVANPTITGWNPQIGSIDEYRYVTSSTLDGRFHRKRPDTDKLNILRFNLWMAEIRKRNAIYWPPSVLADLKSGAMTSSIYGE